MWLRILALASRAQGFSVSRITPAVVIKDVLELVEQGRYGQHGSVYLMNTQIWHEDVCVVFGSLAGAPEGVDFCHKAARQRDLALGFGLQPGGGYVKGWLCNGRPFTHQHDMAVWGVAADSQRFCSGTVSWEIQLAKSGLHAVSVFMWLPRVRGNGTCLLNGHSMHAKGKWHATHGTIARNYRVVVRDDRIRISGPSAACGHLGLVRIVKVTPPIADSDCWDGFYDYHYCCTTSSDVSTPPHCFGGDYTFERCCRTPKRSPSIQAALAAKTSEILPRPPCLAAPYCQRQCLGAGKDFYEHPPSSWLLDAPLPSPLVCNGGLQVHPLSYAIPSELVVDCIPPKFADFALTWAGDDSTYVFGKTGMDARITLLEYYAMYRASLFAVTVRKSGSDSPRHGEVLASGAVPFFPDIMDVPNNTLAHHRKDLLARALALPGVGYGTLNEESFNETAYLELAQELLLWTKHRLTTAAMARYMLSVAGAPEGEWPNLKILYLLPSDRQREGIHGPIMTVLLHGLREILAPENVVDYPAHAHAYEPDPHGPRSVSQVELDPTRRSAFSHKLNFRWRLPHLRLNRSRSFLVSELKQNRFDYVVLATSISPGCHNDLEPEVAAYVPKERIVKVDHSDHTPTMFWEWARGAGAYFKYELPDSCPAGQPWGHTK